MNMHGDQHEQAQHGTAPPECWKMAEGIKNRNRCRMMTRTRRAGIYTGDYKFAGQNEGLRRWR